jgi:hypothetical protein
MCGGDYSNSGGNTVIKWGAYGDTVLLVARRSVPVVMVIGYEW